MTETKLIGTHIRAGVWKGVMVGQASAPNLQVMHLEVPIDGVKVAAVAGHPGQWAVQIPIPVEALSDGVQTFIISDLGTGAKLAHFTVITGGALDEDIRAEIDLLRAELDLLKRAFRRHCLETGS